MKINNLSSTKKVYGYLWNNSADCIPGKWHFNAMQELIKEPIVRGARGIDIGSGSGYDTCIMARDNPDTQIFSVDISDGIYITNRLTKDLSNVYPVKASALNVPFKDAIFDFVYSFGVLHHTDDPRRGLMEMNRVLKHDCPAFLYLYDDHSENMIKFILLKVVSAIRKVTVKLSHRSIYVLSWFFSPLVFLIFTFPAKIMMSFEFSRKLGNLMPFNFGARPFSLRGDLYDRFSAPIEHRFSREQLYDMLKLCGFNKIKIGRLTGIAGWVAWGRKS